MGVWNDGVDKLNTGSRIVVREDGEMVELGLEVCHDKRKKSKHSGRSGAEGPKVIQGTGSTRDPPLRGGPPWVVPTHG